MRKLGLSLEAADYYSPMNNGTGETTLFICAVTSTSSSSSSCESTNFNKLKAPVLEVG